MPKILIHNIETNEVIEREMNADELAQYEADQAASEAIKAEAVAKEAARQAALEKLGLTADEIQALFD